MLRVAGAGIDACFGRLGVSVAILDLRSRESDSETPPETVPEENPPGLDAIRAAIGKLRRPLRGVRLWVRWILRRLGDGSRWIADGSGPAARRAHRLASRAAAGARRAALSGGAASRIAGGLAAIGRDWQAAGGRTGRLGARLAAAARRLRELAGLLARTATGLAAIAAESARLARAARDGEGSEGGDSPSSRLLPRGPSRSRPDAALESRPNAEPESRPADAHESQPDTPPVSQPDAGPETQPDAGPGSPPDADPGSRPGAAPDTRRDPLPETGPDHPAGVPASPETPDRRAAALAELSWPLAAGIRALGRRPRQDVLRPLIVAVLEECGWSTPARLALLLEVGARNLVRRHLGPMVDEGTLERRYPERARHPDQAYRAASRPAPDPASAPDPPGVATTGTRDEP